MVRLTSKSILTTSAFLIASCQSQNTDDWGANVYADGVPLAKVGVHPECPLKIVEDGSFVHPDGIAFRIELVSAGHSNGSSSGFEWSNPIGEPQQPSARARLQALDGKICVAEILDWTKERAFYTSVTSGPNTQSWHNADLVVIADDQEWPLTLNQRLQ